MIGVLSFLRTIICTGVAFVVWYILSQALGGTGAAAVLLPVWVAGIVGGVVATLFNPRQGIMLSFTSSLLLTIGFLWFRHVYLGIGLQGNPLTLFWPLWFPAAFYCGAYGLILLRAR